MRRAKRGRRDVYTLHGSFGGQLQRITAEVGDVVNPRRRPPGRQDRGGACTMSRTNRATGEVALTVREHQLHQAGRGSCHGRRSVASVEAGTPLLEISDPVDLEIVVNFFSENVVRITPAQRAIITGWGGEASTQSFVEASPRASSGVGERSGDR